MVLASAAAATRLPLRDGHSVTGGAFLHAVDARSPLVSPPASACSSESGVEPETASVDHVSRDSCSGVPRHVDGTGAAGS